MRTPSLPSKDNLEVWMEWDESSLGNSCRRHLTTKNLQYISMYLEVSLHLYFWVFLQNQELSEILAFLELYKKRIDIGLILMIYTQQTFRKELKNVRYPFFLSQTIFPSSEKTNFFKILNWITLVSVAHDLIFSSLPALNDPSTLSLWIGDLLGVSGIISYL